MLCDLEVVGRVHQQAQARAGHVGEQAQRLVDRADDVVDIGLEQEDGAVVIGGAGQLGDHRAALLVAFLGLVLRVVHPVAVGGEGAGLADDIGAAQVAGVADQRPQMLQLGLSRRRVGVDDVGVAADGADRQVVVAEGLADGPAFLARDRAGGQVHVLEGEVELDGVEPQRADLLRRLRQRIGEVSGEDADLDHDAFLRVACCCQAPNSARRTARFSVSER